MKLIAFYLLMILLLLSSCKKTEDSIVQTNQLLIPKIGPEIGPGTNGVIPVPEDEYKKLPKYIVDSKEGRLSAEPVDLSSDMPLPDLYGQGTENSCVGWATGYSVRSYLYHIEKSTSYYSASGIRDDKSVFSPRFIYNSLIQKQGPPLDNGSRIDDALNLLMNVGVCTWYDMPYVMKQFAYPVNTNQTQIAGNYKIRSWVSLPTEDGPQLVNYIKNFLKIRRVPVIISIIPDLGFQTPKSNINNGYEMNGKEIVWRNFVKRPSSSGVVDNALHHAIVIVGYDDTKGAFKLMNSYGNGWANKGFIWMDYNLFGATTTFNGKTEKIVSEAYIAISSLVGLVPVQTSEYWSIQIDCYVINPNPNSSRPTFIKTKLPANKTDTKFRVFLQSEVQTDTPTDNKGSSYHGELEGTYNSGTRLLKAQYIYDFNEWDNFKSKFEIALPENKEYTDWIKTEIVWEHPEIPNRCRNLMIRFRRE